MGSFVDRNSGADADLQAFILGRMMNARRASVLSVNDLIDEIRVALPSCPLSDEQVARIVTEAAMLLGLVPVFDRSRSAREDEDDIPAYGYGHPAHRPDPHAKYAFQPGIRRVLPARHSMWWRVTG